MKNKPKMPPVPKELKSVMKQGKPSKHTPSFDPTTKVRDMLREAVNEGQYGADIFLGED